MTEQTKTVAADAVASTDWLAARIAAFRYPPQLRKCLADGTSKRMTPELKVTMTATDQKQCDAVLKFMGNKGGGPRYCGKKPGICAGQHCREIHCC